jgi:hypothetical protein
MLKALSMGKTVDQLPPTDYEVDAPDGGTVRATRDAAPVEVPQRRVVQSNRQTVSGDDNDERGGIIDELSQGISVDERAALNDKRAGPDNTDMRQSFDRMENAFLTGAGLPSLGNRSNPYKDERNDMRECSGKRAGTAQGKNNSALNAERTKAYLDATQSQKELGMRAQELRAEREGREADRLAAKAERERMESERKADIDARKGALDERGMSLKEKEFARKGAPKTAGPKLSPKGFPAGWELTGNTQPTPRQGEQFEGLVYSSEKMNGLTNQMREMVAKGGVGRVLPGEAKSRMSQLAKEIQIEAKNIAELGALSGPDFALMEAIAADPTKIDSLAKDMPALLNGLDAWGKNSVDAKSKALGARRMQATGATPPPSGLVTVRRKSDGVTKQVSPEAAKTILARPEYEEVK